MRSRWYPLCSSIQLQSNSRLGLNSMYNQRRAWVKGENEADSSRQKLLGHSAGSSRTSYGSVVNQQSPERQQPEEATAGTTSVRVFGAMHDCCSLILLSN